MAPSDQDLIPQPDPAGGPRVRTLLASVRDLTASLHRLTTQLELELSSLPSLGPAEGCPAGTGPAAEELTATRAQLDRLRTELEQLRAAQDHRMVIEQAKGMLMAGRRCSEQQAFDLLVGMSQAEQRKVRDIAAEIVAAAVTRPADPGQDGPAADRTTTDRPADGQAAGAPAAGGVAAPTGTPPRPRRIDLDLADTAFPVGRQPRPR